MGLDPVRPRITCPGCDRQLTFDRTSIGRRGKCPACDEVFVLQAPEPRIIEEEPLPDDPSQRVQDLEEQVELLQRQVQEAQAERDDVVRQFKDEILADYREREELKEEIGRQKQKITDLENESRQRAEEKPSRPQPPSPASPNWEESLEQVRSRVESSHDELMSMLVALSQSRPAGPKPADPAPEADRSEGPTEQPPAANPNIHLVSVGFDFGTSTSVLSYLVEKGEQGVFEIGTDPREGYRRLIVPSLLGYLEEEDRFVFGEAAANLPANLAGYRRIPSIKRCLLCEGVNEKGQCANIKNSPNHDICGRGVEKWRLGNREFELEDLIARYLHHVLSRVERRYGVRLEAESTHFSVPVYFGYIARKKMREAVRRAFALLRGVTPDEIPSASITLLHEPSAAAFSQYREFEHIPDEVFCVFDMGGGTTDVAVFEKRQAELWCLGAGSAQVGGDNLDHILRQMVIARISAWPIQTTGVEARRTFGPLYERMSELREELSVEEEVRRIFVLPEGEFELVLSRREFEAEVERTLAEAIDVMRSTLNQVQPILDRFGKDITGYYLVGGVTETPLLQERLQEELRRWAPRAEVRTPCGLEEALPHQTLPQEIEKQMHVLAASLGCSLPRESFREYILDKLPFDIGLVLESDENFREYPERKLLPFYHAFEPLPKSATHEVLVSQNPGNVLNIYMKREGESFFKIIRYLKFPFLQGQRIRYMPTDERIDESYAVRMEITRDVIGIHFGDIAREKVLIPGSHPYYIQKDIQLEWVERLSTLEAFSFKVDGRREEIDPVALQAYLRRELRENQPVQIAKNFDDRFLVLHEGEVIGYLRDRPDLGEWNLNRQRPVLKLIKEDILLPEDLASGALIGPEFRAGDKFIVYDIELTQKPLDD